MYISMGTLLMRILICQYLRPMCLHLRSIWILLWIFVALDGSEWVLGESEFWSMWSSVFYLFCVRVTEIGEVGYSWVTVRITGGHIELEANHIWVKCNYPFYICCLPTHFPPIFVSLFFSLCHCHSPPSIIRKSSKLSYLLSNGNFHWVGISLVCSFEFSLIWVCVWNFGLGFCLI